MRSQRRSRKDSQFGVKVAEGVERNAVWQALTSAQKIASLDARLGKGVGARRQRKILEATQ